MTWKYSNLDEENRLPGFKCPECKQETLSNRDRFTYRDSQYCCSNCNHIGQEKDLKKEK